MIKIKFTPRINRHLMKMGLLTKLRGRNWINADSKFELPCQILNADLSLPLSIGCYSYIGSGFRNYSPLKIGRFCSIGEGVKIGLGSHPLDKFSTSPFFYSKDWQLTEKTRAWNQGFSVVEEYEEKPSPKLLKVEIGDDVWIGANVCILRGVKIGTGAVIGAGAVVTKDVAAYSIVVGIPAKKIKERRIQQEFASSYEPWRVLTTKDFARFLPLKKKIRNFFKKVDS